MLLNKLNLKTKLRGGLTFLLISFFITSPVATPIAGAASPLTGSGSLETVRSSAGYAQNEDGLMGIFGKLVGIILGFMGVVVLVIILLGGFKWITSGGSEEKIKDAQKLIAAGAVGLLIIASAYAISTFITSKVVETGGVLIDASECTATGVPNLPCDAGDGVQGSCAGQGSCT